MIDATGIFMHDGVLTFSADGNRFATLEEYQLGDRYVGSIFDEGLNPGEVIKLLDGIYILDQDLDALPLDGAKVAAMVSDDEIKEIVQRVKTWEEEEIIQPPVLPGFFLNHANEVISSFSRSVFVPRYKELIAALLDLASDKFANHVCNDFNLKEIMPDASDRRGLAMQMHIANGDPENYDPESDYDTLPDYWLMGFFAAQLGK